MKKLKNTKYSVHTGFVSLLSFLLYLLIVGNLFELLKLNLPFMILNVLFFSLVYYLLLFITGRPLLTLPISSYLLFLLHYVDVCVYDARLTHIRISDFSAVSQALRVASHYKPVWSNELWMQLLMILGASLFLFFVCRVAPFKSHNTQNRIVGAAGVFLLCLVLVEGTILHFLPVPKRFSGFDANANVAEAGLVGYWYSQVINRKTEKPEGYNRDIANAILSGYSEVSENRCDEPVNLIVIMDESLTDYSLLGETAFKDPLPYIHNMVDSGQLFEGKLAASVLGGGTCNTEYEFLTGNSMMFLPDGVYAFMAYVTHESNSIARELKQFGYHTSFFHPYYSQEWNREAVYSFFGFDSFTAGDTLDGGLKNKDSVKNITYIDKDDALIFGNGLEYVRHLISNLQTYKLLVNMLSLNDAVADDFMYCVTIQNHGGYTYEGDNFESIEYVTGDNTYKYALETYNGQYSSRPFIINQYLTLSNLSDSAFQELISKLSQSDEKTLVVMFGDHQPGISISDYIEYDKNVHLAVEEETHVVPYFVWSNFDLDYEFPAYISANYLSSVIKQSIGIPLNAWDKFRLDVMKEYPVLTKGFVLDSDYNVVENKDAELLKDYSYVQYMRMFER